MQCMSGEEGPFLLWWWAQQGLVTLQALVQQPLHLSGSLHRGQHRHWLPTEALEERGDEETVQMERPVLHTPLSLRWQYNVWREGGFGCIKMSIRSAAGIAIWDSFVLGNGERIGSRRVKTMNALEVVRTWLSSQWNKTDLYLFNLL